MLRRLLGDFLRWLANAWAKGQVDEARKEEQWDTTKNKFKDAADKWREK